MISCKSVLVSVVICTWSIHEGCHVNDWPNSCQANFMIGSQGCEPCATGSYGCNCSVRCLDNTYGQGCYHVCNCSADEYCDPVEGCTINGSTLNKTKELHYTTQYLLNTRRNNLTFPYAKGNAYQLLKVVGITIATLLVLGVIFNVVCFCVLYRQKSDKTLGTDAKSTDNVRAPGPDEENNDVCSYLTISERSARSSADVNYDDVEESGKSPTASLCSIKGETSNECDPIKISEGDLKVKSDCQPPSDYEEMNFNTKT